MPTDSPESRRRYERVSVRCGCWLEGDDESVFGTTIDLGVGGLFFRTAAPFTVGSDVDVRLHLEGRGAPIVARGTVAWSSSGRRSVLSGIGIEFKRIAEGEPVLREFVGNEVKRQSEPPPPPPPSPSPSRAEND